MPKILIIYTSVGLGHKVVAENVAQALRTPSSSPPYQGGEREGVVEVQLLDLLEMYRGHLVQVSEKLYRMLVRYLPSLWRFFYNNRIFNKLTLPLRTPFASFKANKLARYLEREKPDLILTTQTSATAVISYLKNKGKYKGKLVAIFSDYHFQPYWAYRGVDFYLLNIPEQAEGLENYEVIGLPVDKAFEDYDQEARPKQLILVMGGSRGWGMKKEYVASLLEMNFDMEIAVLVGTREKLARQLESLIRKHPSLKIFRNLAAAEVAKLFSSAKILVTKPGGLTVAQALLKNLPMILINPMPGGEEKNLQYLLERGLALSAHDKESLRAEAERLLQDERYYREIKTRMQNYAQPGAAREAARVLIDMLRAR